LFGGSDARPLLHRTTMLGSRGCQIVDAMGLTLMKR